MKVLAINSGSATLKFAVFELDGRRLFPGPLARGIVEHIGGEATEDFAAVGGPSLHVRARAASPEEATRRAIGWLLSERIVAASDLAAVSHRVVHGGEQFSVPVLLDGQKLSELEALSGLAPLHNAPALAAIHATRDLVGEKIPMVATFDTAFHATLPQAARTYAIETHLAAKHALRRYGFHGLAHRSMTERYAASVGAQVGDLRIVTFQLGGGCSAAAIDRGRSVDTSMGLTPLEGLVMSTRSGDIDPAAVSYLARREKISVEGVVEWLNRRCGLFGLSGGTSDMRELLEREAEGQADAALAIQVFCHRARKYLGAYLAVLEGADAVCFGGGIGENAPPVRERICGGLEFCGLLLNKARNDAADHEGRISEDDSPTDIWVIEVDEESLIAQDAASVLADGGASHD